MRGPPAPAPPATAPSPSSRLLSRTVLPAAGCPAHACPASLLRGSPASSAGPWGPRGPRRPPGGTVVFLLERGREEKSSHWGKETGLAQVQGKRPGWRQPTGLGELGRPFPVLRHALPRCGTHHLNCHILLLQKAALPGSCHCYTLEFSFFTVLFNLLEANIRGR